MVVTVKRGVKERFNISHAPLTLDFAEIEIAGAIGALGGDIDGWGGSFACERNIYSRMFLRVDIGC
jgi:hypothetical protein